MNLWGMMAFSAFVPVISGVDSMNSKSEGPGEQSWNYEGVVDNQLTNRLGYNSPFSFDELQGIGGYLAIEEIPSQNSLLGGHPEALNSLWQISPESDVWVKRQGRELAIVMKMDGLWGVQKLLPLPEGAESPSTAIVWCNSDQLNVLNSGHIWSCSFDGIWIRETDTELLLSGMVELGLVQTQDYLYCWGESASCLIDKNSGVVKRFLDDSWPQFLKEFETPGAVWRVDGNCVDVGLGQLELQFDLARKMDLSDDLAFEGISKFNQMEWTPRVSTDFDGFTVLNELGGILLFFLGVVLGVLIRGKALKSTLPASRRDQTGVFESEEISAIVNQDLVVSGEFQKLVEIAPNALSTREFDEIIENADNVSPESQRSKRAKVIRLINAESQLVLGFALIERSRDPKDRRKVLYKIRSIPERVREQVTQLRESRFSSTSDVR